MNKQKLVDKLLETPGLGVLFRWQVERLVERVFMEIIDDVTMKQPLRSKPTFGVAQFVGFGTFRTKVRKARSTTHPATGKKIDIPEKRVVEFRPGHRFRERLSSQEETTR